MLVTNFLSLNPSLYESSHHEQDPLITKSKIFHFLLQVYIAKPYNFHLKSVCNYEFQTLPHPATFSTACHRSKKSLSIPAATQEYLNTPCSFISLINIRNKKMKSWTHPASPASNKTRNLPPCHLTTLPPFPPCHLTTLLPFPTCHLTTLPPL